MEDKGYLKLAEKFCKYGKDKGASEIQISIYDGKDFSCECREGNIEQLEQANTSSANIKVIVNQQTATANTSDLSDNTLEDTILKAIERAKYSSKDEFAGLPTRFAAKPNVEDLDIYCKDIDNMEASEKINYAKKIEKVALSDKRIKNSGGSSCSTGVSYRILANSNGFSGQYQSTYFSAGVSLQAGTKDEFQEDYWYESTRKKQYIPAPEKIAQTAIERVTRLVGARKVKSQVVPIVFDPQMAGSLIGFLISCLYGSSIYMKQSFLVDKLGEQIAAPELNIYDNAHLPHLSGTRPWDSEGTIMENTPIIQKGVLKSYLLDTYSAKKLNMMSTGHASGISNCYVVPGTASQQEIIKSVGNGLFLTNTIGQGTVPTSGDISKGAFGLWIENGKLTYPVHEITFTGNLGEMLKNIEMIGNDLDMKSSISSPTLKINNVSISGI